MVEVEHVVLYSASIPVRSGYNRVSVVEVVTAARSGGANTGGRDVTVVLVGTGGTEDSTGGGREDKSD